MIYCTYTDLIERFGSVEITQITNQQGPSPAVSDAINDACAEIDSYVSVRYDVPLPGTVVPPVLKRCACEIARYFLWDDKSTDHVRQRYDDAINILKGIALGNVNLPITTENTTASNGVFFTNGSDSVWGARV